MRVIKVVPMIQLFVLGIGSVYERIALSMTISSQSSRHRLHLTRQPLLQATYSDRHQDRPCGSRHQTGRTRWPLGPLP